MLFQAFPYFPDNHDVIISQNNMTTKKKKRVRLKKLLSSIHDAVKRNKVKRTTS